MLFKAFWTSACTTDTRSVGRREIMTSYELGYPEGASFRLQALVDAVAPLDTSIGRWDDRASWRLHQKPDQAEATEEQRNAARAVMAAFDPWGDGSDIGALAEEEDPGEQPEIFTEEDVEALGVESDPLSESEATDNSGTGGSGDPEGGGGEAAYPGIAILPDELGARRNAVLAAIATEKLTRLSIAMDPSRADFLAARFADYQNAGALGLPIDEALAADYRAFQELRDRRDRITNYAMQLEQSALDGDMDRLEAMHAGLGDGWP